MLKSKMSAKSVSRMLTVAGATALALGLTSGTQAGTATSDIGVSATVSANCTISTTTAVAFGAYDPVSAQASTPINQTGALSVTCTTGSNATVTLDEGDYKAGTSTPGNPDRRMTDGSNHYLDYVLYSDSGRTTEWDSTTGVAYVGTGAAEPLTVYARLPAGQNVPVGSYADTVTATITF